MHLGNYITEILQQQGRSKKWLAEQTGIKLKTFYNKIDNDTFTAHELLDIANVLDIDLNELKNKKLEVIK